MHLARHKLDLEGSRYGLHFLGALPNENPTKAVDRVKITPKKKMVRITIDREVVVTSRKKRDKGKEWKANARALLRPASLRQVILWVTRRQCLP